jgi:D-proline reductase (dithiol) PrdB
MTTRAAIFLRRLQHQALARLAGRWPTFAKRLTETFQPLEMGPIPWTAVKKPLQESRIALVTTAGIHHRHQPGFNMADRNGDPSFREIDARTIEGDFRITHDYYDHRDAERDINIVFPLARLRELAAAGCLGSVARTHISFMGHIDGPHVQTLRARTAPQAAAVLAAQAVDIVFLTPA